MKRALVTVMLLQASSGYLAASQDLSQIGRNLVRKGLGIESPKPALVEEGRQLLKEFRDSRTFFIETMTFAMEKDVRFKELVKYVVGKTDNVGAGIFNLMMECKGSRFLRLIRLVRQAAEQHEVDSLVRLTLIEKQRVERDTDSVYAAAILLSSRALEIWLDHQLEM